MHMEQPCGIRILIRRQICSRKAQQWLRPAMTPAAESPVRKLMQHGDTDILKAAFDLQSTITNSFTVPDAGRVHGERAFICKRNGTITTF